MTYSAWHAAIDTLPEKRDIETVDQQIAKAHVLALAAIAQELNHLNVAESPLAERLLVALEGKAESASGVPFRAR